MNFSSSVPFLPLISWVWLPIGSFTPKRISGKRKPPFVHFTLGPPSCHVSAEQRCIRGVQSKGSRMANCHEFLQQVWHLGILLLSPSPRLIAWEPLPWKLLILPASAAALLSLCTQISCLFTPGSEMKFLIYLALRVRPPRLQCKCFSPPLHSPTGKGRIATSPLDLIARQHSAMWICHFCLAQISISPPTVTTLLDVF